MSIFYKAEQVSDLLGLDLVQTNALATSGKLTTKNVGGESLVLVDSIVDLSDNDGFGFLKKALVPFIKRNGLGVGGSFPIPSVAQLLGIGDSDVSGLIQDGSLSTIMNNGEQMISSESLMGTLDGDQDKYGLISKKIGGFALQQIGFRKVNGITIPVVASFLESNTSKVQELLNDGILSHAISNGEDSVDTRSLGRYVSGEPKHKDIQGDLGDLAFSQLGFNVSNSVLNKLKLSDVEKVPIAGLASTTAVTVGTGVGQDKKKVGFETSASKHDKEIDRRNKTRAEIRPKHEVKVRPASAETSRGLPNWLLPLALLGFLVFGILYGLTTCNNTNDYETGYGSDTVIEADGPKICQVTDVGGIDDKSFNATAWKGVELAAKKFNGEAKYLESEQQTDYDRNISAFLDANCDLIVTVGFLLGDATQSAAESNPDQNFAIVDVSYDPSYDNVLGLTYNIGESAFLAGYVAANQTETGVVGTFGGMNIPPVTAFMNGFVLGVDHYNKVTESDVEVLGWDIDSQDGLFAGNFDSTDDGRTLGESLMDEGADIIMPVAGPVGLGTAEAARERGTQIIGVDIDWTESTDYEDVVLTSVLKRMDTTVYGAAQMVNEDKFAGGTFVGTLENNGVSIVTDKLEIDLVDDLNGIKKMIVNGDLTTSP